MKLLAGIEVVRQIEKEWFWLFVAYRVVSLKRSETAPVDDGFL